MGSQQRTSLAITGDYGVPSQARPQAAGYLLEPKPAAQLGDRGWRQIRPTISRQTCRNSWALCSGPARHHIRSGHSRRLLEFVAPIVPDARKVIDRMGVEL
jgi:hypothetical protein